MSEYKEKYGLVFPEDTPDPMVEFLCWKKWREPAYCQGDLKDPWECFWRGIYQILPRELFTRHAWAEQHVYDWTTETFIIVWGAAASGKSNDFGLMTLIDWWVDPRLTLATLASTSLRALQDRSFESVVRYFKAIKATSPFAMPGKQSKTTHAILLDDTEDDAFATAKASIRGVAVAEGTEEEATGKLRGAHLPYVRLVLDELSQMRPAAMSVRTNMAIGARDFKLVGLTNPDSFTDLAARFSTPVQAGGFHALDPEVDFEWRSQYGKVRRHDGLQSPAILEPEREEELSFLLTKSRLDERLAETGGNLDDPLVWTYVRGWPPAQGKALTLISMADVVKYQATQPVTWFSKPALTVIGVDPAFSAGGNRGVMQPLQLGYDKNGELKLNLPPPRFIQIDASSKTPVLEQAGEQIARFVVDTLAPDISVFEHSAALSSLGTFVGVDDSATQSVADYLMTRYGLQTHRFRSNTKASDLKFSVKDINVAKERVHDLATELWAATAAFIRTGQVRGMSNNAARQLTSRPVDPEKRPMRLISKKAKARDGGTPGKSPDEMDAVGYAIGVVRFYLNILAGVEKIPGRHGKAFYTGSAFGYDQTDHSLSAIARKYDIDAGAYQTADVG